MRKIQEIVRLRLGPGLSVREIASACNVGRSTVSKYVLRLEASGLSLSDLPALSEEDLEARFGDPAVAPTDRSIPDWTLVRKEMTRKGVTLKLLWEEYRASSPNAYSYSRYARMYRAWCKKSSLVMVQHHVAGEKLFVDWAGLKLAIQDPKTGEPWQASVFVSATGPSQYVFAKAYANEKSCSWLTAHVEAFEFYGGLPQIVVPDNLRTGVDKACRYEPELNQAYTELATYYDVAVVPTRVRKPKDKAKVENAVQQVERWVLAPLRHRTFLSLEEANEALEIELAKLNDKPLSGLDQSRKQLFEAEDLPAMRLLPSEPYRVCEWKRAKLGPDYHVEIEGHCYSAPFTLVGLYLDVKWSLSTVEIYSEGKRVAAHHRSLSRRGYTTLDDHMPEAHKAQAKWTPERIIRWAGEVGPQTAMFAERLIQTRGRPQYAYRSLMGTIHLERIYGKDRLEQACTRANARGALSYQSVKSILENHLDSAPVPDVKPPLPTHENVRGGDFYAQGETSCAN
jgi:transposase